MNAPSLKKKKKILAICTYTNQHAYNIIHLVHGGDYTDLDQKVYTQTYSGLRYVNHINYLQILYTFE